MYFNISVLFIVDLTSILKSVFPTTYCFCLDGHLGGCVVAIIAAVVVFFLVFWFLFFIYLFIYLFNFSCCFDRYSYRCCHYCHRCCCFCCWCHRCLFVCVVIFVVKCLCFQS